MGKHMRYYLAALVLAFCCLAQAGESADSAKIQAEKIHDATGVEAGLIVHLGCSQGRVTAALHRGDNCIVQGLDADATNIADARRYIRSKGLYGVVSVDQWDRNFLPYGDNLVNLLVAEHMGEVTAAEVLRVLAPGGVAYIRQGETWRKQIKPRPAGIDDWTHYLHDSGGNAVAHDEAVGPPRYLQWIDGPRHTRSHEHTPSINALVSAQGKIFYIADKAPVSSLLEKPQWHLIARDAFNGITLWERSFTGWFPYLINWGVTPSSLQRRLVAADDRVYVTLGLHAPVSAIDAATGKTLMVYEETRGVEEIIFHKGVLLAQTRQVTEARGDELERMAALAGQDNSPLHNRETAQPLVDNFRAVERQGRKAIVAVDPATGRVLWQKTNNDASGYRSLSLCAQQDRVYYQNGGDIMCLELRTGKELWSSEASSLRLVCDENLVCIAGDKITVLSARTGKVEWRQTSLLNQIRDVFVIDGSLWLGGFKPCEGKRGPSWGPYFVTQRDIKSGKVLKHIEPYNPGHHHRCYSNKATDRYILAGRRGVEFFDLDSGRMLEHSWVRGVCRYGVMPCNGLLYAPPHACACYVGTKMSGFSALAASRQVAVVANASAPADGVHYSGVKVDWTDLALGGAGGKSGEWPTYRHDAGRSGSTDARVGAELAKAWQVSVGGKLTPPTAAAGKVFVASVDEHRLCAVDGTSGRLAWEFTAAARIDSPPTVAAGGVFFGGCDGSVYCLRTSDGRMVWRFQGDSFQPRIMASGQLESTLPVHGSVLVADGEVVFTAGRSSYIDGGISLYRLDATTGRMLSKEQVYSPDPETGEQPPQSAPYAMPGIRSDILSCDDRYLYLRDMVFDRKGKQQTEGNSHLFTLTDFLDDSWPHRSYWIYGTKCSISCGCSGQQKGLIYGRLLVFDNASIYGYGRSRLNWSNQLEDGPYRLFAVTREGSAAKWSKTVKIKVRAMALADKILFVAGSVDEDRASGGMLMAVDADSGETLAEYPLDAVPVFDAIAAVNDCLYLTLENGTAVSMAGARKMTSVVAVTEKLR